jgi:hypothetical protein
MRLRLPHLSIVGAIDVCAHVALVTMNVHGPMMQFEHFSTIMQDADFHVG